MLIGTKNKENRDAWIIDALQAISPGLRLIDVGAGEQVYKKYCSHLEYVSQDFNQYDGVGDGVGLQQGKWNTSAINIVSDITAIPVPNDSFDAVLCTEVLEHLPEPRKAINEIYRLLKEGGVLVLTAPFCSLTHFAPYHYYSGFNRYFYEKVLAECGFIVEEITTNGSYFEYLAQELHRLPSMINTYCGVKPSKLAKLSILIMLKYLEKISRLDVNSNAVLCFGYHIKAIKKTSLEI